MKYYRIIDVLLAVMSVGNCFAIRFWMRNHMPFPVMVWPIPKNAPPYMLAKIPGHGGMAELSLPEYVEKIVVCNAHLASQLNNTNELRKSIPFGFD